jgi:hypothetical protein
MFCVFLHRKLFLWSLTIAAENQHHLGRLKRNKFDFRTKKNNPKQQGQVIWFFSQNQKFSLKLPPQSYQNFAMTVFFDVTQSGGVGNISHPSRGCLQEKVISVFGVESAFGVKSAFGVDSALRPDLSWHERLVWRIGSPSHKGSAWLVTNNEIEFNAVFKKIKLLSWELPLINGQLELLWYINIG